MQDRSKTVLVTCKKFVFTFGSVYVAKTTLGLLLKMRSTKNTLKWLDLIKDQDTLRMAASFAGIRSTYYLLKNILRDSVYASSISAFVASLWILVDTNKERRVTISLNAFVKAFLFAIRSYIYRKPGDEIDNQLQTKKELLVSKKYPLQLIEHKNRFLYTVAQGVHLYGDYILWQMIAFHLTMIAFNQPQFLPKGYYYSLLHVTGYLNRYGKNIQGVMRGLGSLTLYSNENPNTDLFRIPSGITSKDFINNLALQPGNRYPFLEDLLPTTRLLKDAAHHDFLICAFHHPQTSSCILAGFKAGIEVAPIIFPTYAAINSLQLIVGVVRIAFRKQAGLEDDRPSKIAQVLERLKRYITSTAQSVLMISAYCSMLTYTLCFLRYLLNQEFPVSYGIAGFIGGPTILFDKPGRLTEMNSYCSTKALISFYEWGKANRRWKGFNFGELMYFMPSLIVLANCSERFPHTVHGISEPVLKWLFSIN